jgi:hypothetical protein
MTSDIQNERRWEFLASYLHLNLHINEIITTIHHQVEGETTEDKADVFMAIDKLVKHNRIYCNELIKCIQSPIYYSRTSERMSQESDIILDLINHIQKHHEIASYDLIIRTIGALKEGYELFDVQ